MREEGTRHRKSRGCKTRKEAEEDRQITDLSAIVKSLTHILCFITRDSNNFEGLGFHGIKLSKM